MASAGSSFHQTVLVSLPVAETSELLVTSLRVVRGYSVTTTDESIVLRRRYVPNWALLVAAVGVFIFFFGLLALFVKETENATILLARNKRGSRITITGVVSEEMREKLTSTLTLISTRFPLENTPESDVELTDAIVPPGIPNENQTRHLLRLAELRERGVLSNEEFEAGKRQILGEGT